MTPASPQVVSRVLREAGLPRGGRYTAWGYVSPGGDPQDGLKVARDVEWVHTPGASPRVGTRQHVRTWVFSTLRYRHGHEQIALARKVLEDHGFVVTFNGREAKKGDSHPSTLAVWKEDR